MDNVDSFIVKELKAEVQFLKEELHKMKDWLEFWHKKLDVPVTEVHPVTEPTVVTEVTQATNEDK